MPGHWVVAPHYTALPLTWNARRTRSWKETVYLRIKARRYWKKPKASFHYAAKFKTKKWHYHTGWIQTHWLDWLSAVMRYLYFTGLLIRISGTIFNLKNGLRSFTQPLIWKYWDIALKLVTRDTGRHRVFPEKRPTFEVRWGKIGNIEVWKV